MVYCESAIVLQLSVTGPKLSSKRQETGSWSAYRHIGTLGAQIQTRTGSDLHALNTPDVNFKRNNAVYDRSRNGV